MKEHKEYLSQTHSYMALRKAVGWIGILLPFVLVLGAFLLFGSKSILKNISLYYHTGMRDVFVGALCAIALFLFFYKGYDRRDNIAGNLAGFFALGIAFFPTVAQGPWDWKAFVHFACAGLFFLILALFSLFLFTRSEPQPSKEKLRRNVIYIACGSIMVVALSGLLLFMALFAGKHPQSRFVFWAETVALVAFGISWLTKGGTLYPDVHKNDTAKTGEENA